jgi:hypothetical protein
LPVSDDQCDSHSLGLDEANHEDVGAPSLGACR